jgi:protein-tyrosine phosphatase
LFDKLRELFGEKKEEPSSLTDYGLMAVDIHSHLIPGIDDGVKTIDDSIYLLRQFEALGFKKVITSPHVMSDGYQNSTETILAGRDKVRAAIRENNIALEFDAAAEYYVDEGMHEKIEKKDLLTIGDNFVLVEFSYLNKGHNTGDVVYKLQVAGYRVLLAHPERYPYYYDNSFDQYKSLKDRNIYFQINIMSLLGKYGKDAKFTAEKMIDENMVNFVGTDCHNARQMETIKECLSMKYLDKILHYDKLLNKTLV